MSRSLAYTRDVSKRKAKHKQFIAEQVYGFAWYDNLHAYSKGKVHCSCPCCSVKTNSAKNKSRGAVDPNRGRFHTMKISGSFAKRWKPSDQRKIQSMEYQEETGIYELLELW